MVRLLSALGMLKPALHQLSSLASVGVAFAYSRLIFKSLHYLSMYLDNLALKQQNIELAFSPPFKFKRPL